MQLNHTPKELVGLPAPEGAHRLAWSYLLDAACADAYHVGVVRIEVTLPPSLAGEIEARQPFSGGSGAPDGPIATFGTSPEAYREAVRHYVLRFGALAPRTLRAANIGRRPAFRFELERTLYVYTLRTRLLGIPMRILNLLDRPRPADRALIELRHAFASERPTPCYYRLETWRRTEPA